MKTLRPARAAFFALSALSTLAAAACAGTEGAARSGGPLPGVDGVLFTKLPASYTGVAFENRLTPTSDFNVFTYRNFYNGGGVAAGDLTGDGLPDLVLTANQGGPKLFVNLGRFQFRDATKAAGIHGSGRSEWTTGVTMADVNGDGRLDLYICHAGSGSPGQRANELYVNQGVQEDGTPRFEEQASDYGLADEGYSTQAAFLDFDRDGRLDLFLINNSPRAVSSFDLVNDRDKRSEYGGHKLYHNVNGRFVNVTEAAGIRETELGFGLGVGVSDVNGDGWPDVYVANDFFERDYLYVNNRDGTFTESIERAMPAISYSSMGMDIADVDNDGLPDVYTTDMLPEDEYRLKTNTTFESWAQYQARVRYGYHRQFTRNMLQVNNGNGTFSDIGQLAGVARTDWSWGALIADLDLDGHKDIFVTNGIARDVTSRDYLSYLVGQRTAQQMQGGRNVDFLPLVNAAPSTRLSNYAFRNNADRTFTNESASWGLATPSFSSGVAYADLDGDGALDLVVNNVNDTAFVYRNNARALTKNAWLQVWLEGEGTNSFGVGARVAVYAGRDTLVQELSPTRGFQSSVDYVLTFGLGPRDTVDSVVVRWPDGRVGSVRGVASNQRLTLRQAAASAASASGRPATPRPLYEDVTGSIALAFTHNEGTFVDFDREPLMPRMLSTEGPGTAVADVNGDRLDDVFIGGGKGQAGKLLIQQRDGSFASSSEQEFARDAISDDVGALFFEANGDGRPDLYVVSGGSEYSEAAPALADRLYMNDGRGNFHKAAGALPALRPSGSRAAAADFDGDGDQDLFVGGRSVPWHYGRTPRSMLLRNDGSGRFTDVTDAVAPGLGNVGMVTDALWRDVDGDGSVDLVIVGEWMPITVFRRTRTGTLAPMTIRGLERSNGWWNRVVAGDFTGDGRVDFVVGNLGLNSRLRASDREPVTMYVGDFAHTGLLQQVVSSYSNGVSYPLALRDAMVRSIPALGARFPTFRDYALAKTSDVLGPEERGRAELREAYTFATSLARNNGDGSFTLVPLPVEAQYAPVYGILATDADSDGKTDLFLAGNFDGMQPELGTMSASYGLLLLADGKGSFAAVKPARSGFVVPGQTRGLRSLRTARGDVILAARFGDRPLLFRRTEAATGSAAASRSTGASF